MKRVQNQCSDYKRDANDVNYAALPVNYPEHAILQTSCYFTCQSEMHIKKSFGAGMEKLRVCLFLMNYLLDIIVPNFPGALALAPLRHM